MTYRVEIVDAIDEDSFLHIYNSNKDETVENSGYEDYDRLLLNCSRPEVFKVAGIDNSSGQIVAYACGILDENRMWHIPNIVSLSPSVFMALSGDLMHKLMFDNNIPRVKTWCKRGSNMETFVSNSLNRTDLYDPGAARDLDEDFVNIIVGIKVI